MEKRPLIFVDMSKAPKFCDNRCNNTSCKKHISKLAGYYGAAKISKLRDTEDCEGYISKRKQPNAESKQDTREAGIEE